MGPRRHYRPPGVPAGAEPGADRQRRAGRHAGAHRTGAGQDRDRRRAGQPGGLRWPVHPGQGGAGRLSAGRRGVRGTRDRDRGAGVGRAGTRRRAAAESDRGAAAHGTPTRRGPVTTTARIEDLLRELAPQALGAVVRRYGEFDAAEDAVQEALLAAAIHWPAEGLPDNPRGWLIQTAVRRLTDQYRSNQARRRREESAALREVPGAEPVQRDDALVLLFMCCHPALTPASSIALTLRAVAGLSTAEIATAFLVPEATMAQRISRAKQRIKASGIPFRMPAPQEFEARLRSVLHVLYLLFNEGYTSSAGAELHRTDLSGEAIRLTRTLHAMLPE